MWRFLPKARSRLLAVTAAANVMERPVGLVVAPLFALLAWGIWTLSRAARWVTIIWIWVMVVVMLLGVVGPFAPQAPADASYWGSMLAAITPLVVAGLFFILVFGRHKREFKWP